MDTCFYCGNRYHPMPVWVNPATGRWRWVCNTRLVLDENGELKRDAHGHYMSEQTDCREKAKADGFEFRRDLTPRR